MEGWRGWREREINSLEALAAAHDNETSKGILLKEREIGKLLSNVILHVV